MDLLLISDLHLAPSSPERNQQFLDFLEQALKNGDQIVIAGDLFDLWLGWPDLTFDYQKPILDRMRELMNSGLIMDYIEGNRDFSISHYRGSIFRDVYPKESRREWSGKKLHLEHGDLINRSDRQYRLWRTLSKNRLTYFVIDRLPSWITMRLAVSLERGLRKTNQKHRMYYPEQNAEAFYTDLFQCGIDVVILGHFHIEKSVQQRLNERTVLFYNLPGWEQGFRYLVVPAGNKTPYFKDWEKDNGNSATA